MPSSHVLDDASDDAVGLGDQVGEILLLHLLVACAAGASASDKASASPAPRDARLNNDNGFIGGP